MIQIVLKSLLVNFVITVVYLIINVVLTVNVVELVIQKNVHRLNVVKSKMVNVQKRILNVTKKVLVKDVSTVVCQIIHVGLNLNAIK